MRLGILQYAPIWEDATASREKITRLVGCHPGCDLLVLPEMCLTGFSMEPERTQVSPEDHAFFEDLARAHNTAVAYCVGDAGQIVIFLRDRDGALIGRYAKRHLFAPGGEAAHYQSGEVPPEIWNWEDWRILPSLCYDLRFPYQFWHTAQHSDLILLPANWPTARANHWRTLLAARSIENQCWVAGINRTGDDPKTRHHGHSQVYDPTGEIALEAGHLEGLFTVDLKREEVALRRERFPAFADRRE